ncbi:hypothetical protein [Massilia psychrophila]|uniref:hypothetical protein n=1 Tax=Massilia psychrophila TaxID=1603353 RepID=UPI0015D4CAFA|nr:hypothetical protein [Massilia psychrophila]
MQQFYPNRSPHRRVAENIRRSADSGGKMAPIPLCRKLLVPMAEVGSANGRADFGPKLAQLVAG